MAHHHKRGFGSLILKTFAFLGLLLLLIVPVFFFILAEQYELAFWVFIGCAVIYTWSVFKLFGPPKLRLF